MNDPGWYTDGTNASVTKVVFNSSFGSVRPTSTYEWFYDMNKLQTITGISYLKTDEVTNMGYMFRGCTKLTSIDVSRFNTSNVIYMLAMFYDCRNLLDLDLRNFNTSNVTSMAGMFSGCNKLTSIDVSSFNTSKVINMLGMFSDCSNLTTIYAGEGWSMATVSVNSNMFTNCTKLVGGKGTTNNLAYTNGYYARIDGGPSNPGYFTDKNASQPGDVNGDGFVNVADVTALINIILNR